MAGDRAYIPGGRIGETRAILADLCARIIARLTAAGAMRVEPAALHPANRLLDVYGEELRARAFTVEEVDGREMFLRPDFTLPVLELHQSALADPARYCYLGPVWRRQDFGSKRPSEFLQAGVEIFGEDAGSADADAFILMRDALAEGGVNAPEVQTGDLGLGFALLDAIPMNSHRRAALRRHFWRPKRFQDLLRRYRRDAPAPSPLREMLLGAANLSDLCSAQGAMVGARTLDEIDARLATLRVEQDEEPLRYEDAKLLDAALAIACPAGEAHAAFADLARAAGHDVTPALDRFARRIEALSARGLDAATLPFRASFGRNMEYYDGFVFEFSAPERPDLPALAAGGRYDGLSSAIGLPDATAVGGMVRPEALMAAGEAA